MTNQASEDELHKLAAKFDMDEYGTVNENGGYLIGEVRKLIRTEKLKLLAEVRERVQVNQKGQFEEDSTGTVCWYLDDLVEALKELEAKA